MNIIHTCITIRLNYPMIPLYHHNKTYVCASSRYEIMIHKQYLAYQYTILYTPLDLLYKYLVQYGSTIHFIFISELYYFLLDFFLLGFAEGYFTVSLIIYIATYLILRNPINTLFYPEIYPVLFGLFYLGYKVNKKHVE